jgi:hypothetical protein
MIFSCAKFFTLNPVLGYSQAQKCRLKWGLNKYLIKLDEYMTQMEKSFISAKEAHTVTNTLGFTAKQI